MYKINEYTSEYNDKYPNKKKGSGIGIYVHNDYTFHCNHNLSRCTKNIESLFITITNTIVPITVGNIYRPHTGSVEGFLVKWEDIIKNLPQNHVHLMGDFNIDFFKQCQQFETSFYSYNFIPTISLATHEKPGCSQTLLDNIFINSSENLINSGTFEEKVSHHCPVFCVMNYHLPTSDDSLPKYPKYDYCEAKVNTFLQKVEDKMFSQS